MSERLDHIDFLRSVSIIGVIIIHTLSYSFGYPYVFPLWNYLHFVVVGFVFCSGYVLMNSYGDKFHSIHEVMIWYKKRGIRLLLPYYIYLLCHYTLSILLPGILSGLGLQRSTNFFINSIFLIGGVDLNWLPLLFLELMLLFPLLIFAAKKKYALSFFIAFATLFTTVQTFTPFIHIDYRLTMWIPWSLILLIAMKFALLDSRESKSIMDKRYLSWAIVSLLFYGALSLYANLGHIPIILANQKYPPDFYYLSYGIGVTCIVLWLSLLWKHAPHSLKKFNLWLSAHSYQLFFIHYIVLDSILTTTTKSVFGSLPIVRILMVLPISLVICFFFMKLNQLFKKLSIARPQSKRC